MVGPIEVGLVLDPLRGEIVAANIAVVLVVVVLLAAILGGRIGGAVAALSAALAFDIFFTVPYNSLRIDTSDDIETTVLLLVVGLVAGEIVVRARRSHQAATTSRREVVRMQRVAEVGAGSDSPAHLIDTVRRELETLFPVARCWYETPPFPTTMPQLRHGRVTVPPGDPQIAALDPEPSRLVEVRVFGNGSVRGRFVLEFETPTAGVSLAPESRALALSLADQLGVALAAPSSDREGRDQT